MELWQDKCNRTPMDLTSVKTLIASVTQTISRTIMLGDEAYTKSLLFLNTLVYSLEYAITQLEAGNTAYETKIQKLKAKLLKLQYECEAVCIYKEKYDFNGGNMPPTIDDNTITVPYTQPQVPTNLPPVCEDVNDLAELRVTPYGIVRPFARQNFTTNPNVDKIRIKRIYFIAALGSKIEYKRQNIALGNNNIVNLTDLNVTINLDEIEDLKVVGYPASFTTDSGTNFNGFSLSIGYVTAYKDSLDYSQQICYTDGRFLYE